MINYLEKKIRRVRSKEQKHLKRSFWSKSDDEVFWIKIKWSNGVME
jgi:hypothetical protein